MTRLTHEDEYLDDYSDDIVDSSASDRRLDDVSEVVNGDISPTWVRATEIIKTVRPIPWAFWGLIRSVWGSQNPHREIVDSSHFTVVEKLVLRAAGDPDLTLGPVKGKRQFTDFYNAVGPETTASLCFIHAVCKRVSVSLQERVFKAIIDDALLRARLGVVLSQLSPKVSTGAGLLVGFSGRAGLAIQLASGTEASASEALKSLATGQSISSTGISVYGCDPLQVGALALIAGGCNKQIATGISAIDGKREDVLVGSPQYDWMLYFNTIEQMRIGRLDSMSPAELEYLAIGDEAKKDLAANSKLAFRSGHNFDWLLLNLSEM